MIRSHILACTRFLSLSLTVGSLTLACASSGPFVWYSQLPRAQANPGDEYTLGVGDGCSVRVYEQDGLGGAIKIRSDGRVTLPLIGEVVAAGKHPRELAAELELQFKRFVVSPRVTVTVEQSVPISVSVLGEAAHTGVLTLERPARLLQALAQAGVNEYADKSKIFVLRQYPSFVRIRFTYEAIVNNTNNAANFPLMSGDVIMVE